MAAIFTRTIQYVPVGITSPPVSATSAIQVDDSEIAINKIGIPAGYDPGQDPAIDVPFGSVGTAATGVFLYNANTEHDILITIGAAVDLFRLPPGGTLKIACPTDPTTGRVTAISFKTSGVQVADAKVHSYIFGE